MNEPLVSVIMSLYNESINEIELSIGSVIEQSYKNIEIIVIDDNPENIDLREKLNSISDNRVNVVYNDKNIGLVKSLNKALKYTHGNYIARMDADDICIPTRIKDEMQYLHENEIDLVGAYVTLINENGSVIKPEMRLPVSHEEIRKYMRWGNCICHPTWLAKRKVYEKLGGYRAALHCEDYDFLLRAIKEGFILGNIPKIELKYRVRKTGVSQVNADNQYLLRDYLAKQNICGIIPSEKAIEKYMQSEVFSRNRSKLEDYHMIKSGIKNGGIAGIARAFCIMPINIFFWKDLIEKVMQRARER